MELVEALGDRLPHNKDEHGTKGPSIGVIGQAVGRRRETTTIGCLLVL